MRAAPKIYVDASIAPGAAVVAAAHAALAWRLRSPIADREPYGVDSVIRVESADLPRAKAAGPHIVMTESRLGHREVAVIVGGADEPALIGLAFDPKRAAAAPPNFDEVPLRMYVVVDDLIFLRMAAAAAANVVVRCYGAFADDPVMREWIAGRFTKSVCKANPSQLRQLESVERGVAIRSPETNRILATAFCPRHVWPSVFRYLPLYR